MAFEEQGGVTNARADTRLLIKTVGSATTDLSHWVTDLTADSGFGYEDPTTLRDIGDLDRCVFVQFDSDNTDTGTLVWMGDNTGTPVRYQISIAAGVLSFITSAGTVGTLTTDLAGVNEELYVQWSTRHNPLTTGAGDAVLSEVVVHNIDQDTWIIKQYTHAVTAAGTADAFSYGGRWDGVAPMTDLFSGPNISAVQIGVRFHSTAEMAEDWIAATAAPTVDSLLREPILPMPVEPADDANFAGPVYAYGARSVFSQNQLLHSPSLNLLSTDEVWRIVGGFDTAWDTVRGNRGPGSATALHIPQATLADVPGVVEDDTGRPGIGRSFGGADFFGPLDVGTTSDIETRMKGDNSFSMYIRWDGTATAGVVFELRESGGNFLGQVRVNTSGNVEYRWQEGAAVTHTATSNTALTANTIHHVAIQCTLNGANFDIAFWLDDVADGTDTGQPRATTGAGAIDVTIGATAAGNVQFQGDIFCIKLGTADQDFSADAGRAAPWMGMTTSSVPTAAHIWQLDNDSVGGYPGLRHAMNFREIDLDGTTYLAMISWVKRVSYPRKANKWKVGLQMRVWSQSGNTPDLVNVAVVSSTVPPGFNFVIDPENPNAHATNFITGSRGDTTDDGIGGAGDWITLSGELDIARIEGETSYVWVSFNWEGTNDEEHTCFEIQALTLDPLEIEQDGSLPLQFPP